MIPRSCSWARAAQIGVLAVGLGCAGVAAPRPDEAGAQRDYAAALRLAGEDAGAGARALEEFLRGYPRSVLADDAGLRLASLQVEAGAPIAATRTLERLVRLHPGADRADSARLLLAQLFVDRGLPQQAYRAANQIRLARVDATTRRTTQRLLADLARENRDTVALLRWLGRVRGDARSQAEAQGVDREIGSVLQMLAPAELEAAGEQLGKRIPAGRVRLRQAELAIAAGDSAAAARALESARKLPLAAPDADQLSRIERRLAGNDAGRLLEYSALARPRMPGPTRGTLGVVLPLSGRYASFGEATLQGVLLATGHFDPTEGARSSEIRLIVRDSGGRPERAAAAVRELAARPEVSAILGPMLADESEAAAAAAEEATIPLLTLSRRESVAANRAYVLRLGETPRLDAELMAAYAVDTLGLERFAILYPDLEFGRALRGAFWDAVEARGGEVVGVARYLPDATDFAAPVRRLIGFELLSFGQIEAIREREKLLKRAKRLPAEEAAEIRQQAREMTGPKEAPLPPFVDFQALFIPDTHGTVGLIAPHLAFHELRGVRLLGTSPWNGPELLRLGGRHVDGAVFTAGSFGGSERPYLAEYHRRFEERFERAPGDLSAAAFDAANLAVVGMARAGGDRDGLLRSLRALGRWSGVSGTIGFGSDGKPWKRPHLLGIHRGEIVSVDERGEPPYLRIPEPDLVCEEGPDGEEVCVPAPTEGDEASASEPLANPAEETSR